MFSRILLDESETEYATTYLPSKTSAVLYFSAEDGRTPMPKNRKLDLGILALLVLVFLAKLPAQEARQGQCQGLPWPPGQGVWRCGDVTQRVCVTYDRKGACILKLTLPTVPVDGNVAN